jgi:formate hydrogenlyase transcriptional activator
MSNSDERFRMMIDKIPALAWSCFPDGTAEFLNQRWLAYTGLSLEASLGWGWRSAIHPDDLARLEATWRRAVASGDPREREEARLRRFDGEYRWFLFRSVPIRDDHGTVVRWLGTNTDIEGLKRAEGQLRRSEQELRQIIDAIPQAILVVSADGRILDANQPLLEYTGRTIDDVMAGHPIEYHPDDEERVRDESQRALARGLPFQLEYRSRRKDGQYRWFLILYRPLRDEQGSIIRWYATGIDIDDRKRAEERVRNENLVLREEIDETSMFEEIVGTSAPLRAVLSDVSKVAPTDSTVLITGETGTGKELVARAIHKRSPRAARAFVSVNCSAIPSSLIASELFGHERGAFTGAAQRRHGRFELADGGTIFLDEVGDLPAEIQVTLLRVLQEREFERVGGTHSIRVNVRVIAATNRDLTAAVADGSFRADLFYRLNVFPLEVPSLRDRRADIPVLVEYFTHRFAKRNGKTIRGVTKDTLSLLQAYDWPGNIRELQNVIERAVIVSDSDTLSLDSRWLPGRPAQPPKPQATVPSGTLAAREKDAIEAALRESRGRVSGPFGAAAKLGVPSSTLESKIKALDIDKRRFKEG